MTRAANGSAIALNVFTTHADGCSAQVRSGETGALRIRLRQLRVLDFAS
jgi:hypothetical protein